jgi:hypothetical protein
MQTQAAKPGLVLDFAEQRKALKAKRNEEVVTSY